MIHTPNKATKESPARFFESDTGRVPVRDWLLGLTPEDRKAIGYDIRTAEFGGPIGMPLCRAIKGHKGLVGNPQPTRRGPHRAGLLLRS